MSGQLLLLSGHLLVLRGWPPTPLLVKCIDVLLPVITKMVNISLESGHFSSAWKEALVRPILKKNSLDIVLKNYRPVSNLSFISKVTERAVFLQIDDQMKKHDLYPSLQSDYRKNHSTETALLKVTNDILMEMNSQCAVLLVLLDLSAAFDIDCEQSLIFLCKVTAGETQAREQRAAINEGVSPRRKNKRSDC